MSSTRDFKSPGIFAEDATTVIPPTPIAGVAYRDSVNGTDDTQNGWRYGTRVASQDFNQIMFLLTSMLGMIDKQGVLGWSPDVDYDVPALVFASNGLPYLAMQASGPSTAAQDPIAGLPYWSEFAMHGRIVLTTSQTWAVPAAMQLGYIRPFVTVIGGGGGGARISTSPGASGGGGGGICSAVVNLTSVPSVAVTVGSGGAGGATNGSSGTAGTGSVFSVLTAGGGAGGNITGGTGAGGTGAGGSINESIGSGGPAVSSPTGSIYGGVGGGGTSPSGGTGSDAPPNFGHGGAGRTNTAAPAGAPGAVIIEW